jgi:Lon protease-like protein
MSDLLPLFPLPNVVLFPNVFLPLHIFEPRYREMVADALAGDRLIGMVLLKPGWERNYEGRPPVYPIGCSGLMTHVERLADGRYNIVLRGVERFRIVQEDHRLAFRRATVEHVVEEELTPDDRVAVRRQRARLEAMLKQKTDRPAPAQSPAAAEVVDERAGARLGIPSAMSDEDLVNALAQYLNLEPLEKQALLEQSGLRARAESLVELLEMKVMMARVPRVPGVAH